MCLIRSRNSRNDARISKVIRRRLGISGKPYPIIAVDGFAPPKLKGSRYYFTTPSGKTIVKYPNAYGYRTLYHPSTLRVEVGKGWLISKGLI